MVGVGGVAYSHHNKQKQSYNSTAIIVLGNRKSSICRERMKCAWNVIKKKESSLIILSGGQKEQRRN